MGGRELNWGACDGGGEGVTSELRLLFSSRSLDTWNRVNKRDFNRFNQFSYIFFTTVKYKVV